MRQNEDFSSTGPANALFLLGKNSRGQWVAQDQSGKRGGLFVSQAAALKFALFENGRKPELVVNIPGVFELDLSAKVAEKLAA
jgi:hypothetical protein